MRILLISSFFPPETLGGLEQSAYEAALGLHNKGLEVEVLSCEWRKPGQSEIAPFPVHRLFQYSNPAQYYGHRLRTIPRRFQDAASNVRVGRVNLEKTRAFLQDKTFDICAVWAFSGISPAVTLAASELGIPVVWHVGDFNLRERMNPHWVNDVIHGLTSASWMKIERSIDVSHVLANSRFTQRSYIERGFKPEGVEVIYRGMDASLVQDAPLPRAQPPVIYMACRVTVQKGIEVAVKALALLRAMKGTENVELHIAGVGDPDYVASVQKLIVSSGLEGKAKLLGQIPRAAALEGMRTSSIVLSGSLHEEYFGRVNIEAMAAASPLLASDTDNVKEIGEDGKELLMYRQFSPEDLAKKAHRLLTEPGLADGLVTAGTQRVRAAFTQSVIDDEIEAYYRRLLAQTAR